jgi:hypothetical protein
VANLNDTNCVRGWVELLHFKADANALHAADPPITSTNSLANFVESHYECVGSTLPLCEYYSAFEIYQQFAASTDEEFNVPRPFEQYDAINLCVSDPNFGNKVTTLMVWSKKHYHNIKFRASNVQYHPKYPHCLVIRNKPFKSFKVK